MRRALDQTPSKHLDLKTPEPHPRTNIDRANPEAVHRGNSPERVDNLPVREEFRPVRVSLHPSRMEAVIDQPAADFGFVISWTRFDLAMERLLAE